MKEAHSQAVRIPTHSELVVLALPLRVRSLEVFDLVFVEVPQPRRHFVDQVVIVRHQQHRAFVALQRDVERVDGFEVQVVRRLVEDEDVRLGQDQLAEHQSRLLAAGQGLGLLFAFFAAEKHLAQECRECLPRGLPGSSDAATRLR